MKAIYLTLLPWLAVASPSKISPALLQDLALQVSVPAMVRLKRQADLSQISEIQSKEARTQQVYDALRKVALESQSSVVQYLESKKIRYRRFYIANVIAAYDLSAEQVAELAAMPEVENVAPNKAFRVLNPIQLLQLMPSMDSSRGIEANLVASGAPKAWELGFKGQNIVIAGQDTGVEWAHPGLKAQYRGTQGTDVDHDYSWHDSVHAGTGTTSNPCGYDTQAPCDDHGHGTHTIGTVVGDDGKGNQVGMAPNAKWIACRNMDEGVGTPASYIECFEWFLAPYRHGGNPLTDGIPEKAPHVINNSWGCPESENCHGDELLAVLSAMKKAGIIVVAAAGNEGPGCGSIGAPPASHSAITIAVGALDHRSGKIAYFSSRGPSTFDKQVGPDVSAPGVEIRSTIPGGKFSSSGWSGTSMASPHVTGLVALLLSAKSSLIGNFDAINDLITKTATAKTTTENCGGVLGTLTPNNTYGYGMIDAEKSIKQTQRSSSAPFSPPKI